MDLRLEAIAQATQGRLVGDSGAAELLAVGMSWDSRKVEPGWLYVAFSGEHVDGHDFIDSAAAAGAVAALVEREVEAPCALIVVDDTREALERLAAYWRTLLEGTVIGLTGSTGKTTTKGLMRDVLAKAGTVQATAGNQNNEIGVPRTLLAASRDTDAIVVEMGMRGLGQIAELCQVAKPDWGLITNIGESHMELLGSQDNIARAKGELFDALPNDTGVAFVNAEDGYGRKLCEHARLRERGVTVVHFDGSGVPDGIDGPRVWAEEVTLDGRGYGTFTLRADGFAAVGNPAADGASHCELRLKGAHNIINACAAAAIGLMAGLSLEDCREALEESMPEAGRQQIRQTSNGALIVNDAYNANPDSMMAALSTFEAFEVAGQRIAVLGDMGELGPIEDEAHRRVGEHAASTGLDRLYCVGDLAAHIAEGARSAGMDPARVIYSDNLDEVLGELEGRLGSQDAILVKASHFMGFERLVEGLVG